ncbi:MAG: MFS transporter [Synergistaceae bacterium]|jgi:Na+/melibiose symporter-like transporter|nr:MFS transporter [Synergistaceae bacterium]
MKSLGSGQGRSIYGYAAVNFGYTLLYMAASSFLMYFYTDVATVSVGAVSVILFVSRFFDVAIDPFIGYYMDKRSTRYGKFKGYIYYWAFPSCALFAAMFLPSPFAGAMSVAWRLFACMAWGFCLSMIEVSNLPLLSLICSNERGRSLANTTRVSASIVAVLAVSCLTFKLVTALGGGSEERGFAAAALVIAVCALASFLCGARNITERGEAEKSALPFLETLREVFQDRRLVFLYLLVMCDQIVILTRTQSALYYLKYCVMRADLVPVFFMTGIVSSIATQPLVFMALKRYGIRRLMVCGYLAGAAAMIATGAARMSVSGILTCAAVYGAATAFPSNLIFVCAADLSDSLSGRRNASFCGTISSLLMVASKIGSTVAGSAVALVLYLVSYVPNAEQSARSLLGIKICFFWFSAVLLLICAFFAYMSFNPGDNAPKERREASFEPGDVPVMLTGSLGAGID